MDGSRQSIRVRVGDDPIDVGLVAGEVGRTDAGATVVFVGTVRDHSEGKTGVTHLDYEVYAEKVESEIARMVSEAADQWPILNAVVEHRSGVVNLGEASVVVAVSCAHRGDAFEAARYIIEELKNTAPIWKKEFWPGGSEWSRGS